MTERFKLWLSWKGINSPSAKQKLVECAEMIEYYEAHKPVNMPYKRKH